VKENFRFLGAAVAVGIGSMLTLIALGSRQEIMGLVGSVWLSVLAFSDRRVPMLCPHR
jgi:hypothetical protein